MAASETIDAAAPMPPDHRFGPAGWARRNLFSTWYNALLTVVFAGLTLYGLYRGLRFVFVTADWTIVERFLTSFMVGAYPRDQLWRIWTALYVLAVTLGFAAGAAAAVADQRALEMGEEPERIGWGGWLRRMWPVLLLMIVLVGLAQTPQPGLLLSGALVVAVAARWLGRRTPRRLRRYSWILVAVGLLASVQVMAGGGIGWDSWGGLLLTVFVTVFGIILAFPIGLLAALGRRSTLPVVRLVTVGYIEFIRGVPLISLLLMSQFFLGFFLPRDFDKPSDVTLALIAIALFEAAYVAEIVRGGLQSIPKGQFEAGQALGLSPYKSMRLIILPQALRAVIPAMVGQFISLFKDTSLLTIIGLFDLLAFNEIANSADEFFAQRLQGMTLAFIGFIYWVGSFTMSRESQRLERKLGVGER